VSTIAEDRFLNGKVTVRQPVDGFRSGLDAVMLAAAIPASAGDEVLELGAGTGTASLCLAARVRECAILGVEIDPNLAELAAANAAANGMASRVRFMVGNALALPSALKREFAHVFSNPPFHGDAGEPSPNMAREHALRDAGHYSDWLRAGLKRTGSSGMFTTILRADRLGEALQALPASGIVIFPLWPRSSEAAKRIILQIRKGSGAPPVLLSGLVLHRVDGRFTAEADEVLRGGASLALDKPRL
jgi:tRNA1Val (adenine37-N6)-methyltransferase